MSVIYKSLTKLSSSGNSGAATAGKTRKGPGRPLLKASGSPNKSALGLAIIVVAVGLFGYLYLDELKGLSGTRIEISNEPLVVAKRIPEQVERRPDLTSPAKVEPQAQPTSSEENLAAGSQYLPPQKNAAQSPKTQAAAPPAVDKVSIADAKKPVQPAKTAPAEPESETAPVPPAAQERVDTSTGKSSVENGGKTIKKPQKTQEEKHLEILAQEHRINELIDRIKFSMASSDIEHTEKLFDRLEKLKGQNNSYVLKLRAFWCMQNGDQQLARSLLEKVLSRNENDREAGLNMAVLEINSDQLPQARARLRKLKEAYPNDSSIHELYLQLE